MRVTIDVDGGELEALIKLLNLMHYTRMFPRAKYEMYRTRRGYHIVARDLPITFQESLLLRMMVGDDATRIALDEVDEAKPKQVLFTWKRDRGRRKPLNILEFIFRNDERGSGHLGLRDRARGAGEGEADKAIITLAKQHDSEIHSRAQAQGIHNR
jgi:hypothetical protein